ncbi:MAG: LysE family translocator [Magnetococcales bacterium]|nr:LysE family translocator [Magnetococcales bacterium]
MMAATLLVLASVTFIAMMSPGPDMLMVIKHGSAKERWPVVACIAGICCGVTVHVAFSILGIAVVISTSATLFTILKIAGSAYLIYIGVKSLLSTGGLSLDGTNQSAAKKHSTPFRDGLFCNVLNPKVTMFILAVFTKIIEPSTPVDDKIIYGIFMVFEVFIVWNIFITLVRTKLVLGFMQRFQVAIDRITGVVLIGFGGALALEENI